MDVTGARLQFVCSLFAVLKSAHDPIYLSQTWRDATLARPTSYHPAVPLRDRRERGPT
jgi:hypothetical protein